MVDVAAKDLYLSCAALEHSPGFTTFVEYCGGLTEKILKLYIYILVVLVVMQMNTHTFSQSGATLHRNWRASTEKSKIQRLSTSD